MKNSRLLQILVSLIAISGVPSGHADDSISPENYDYAKLSAALSSDVCALYKAGKTIRVPIAGKSTKRKPWQTLFYFRINDYDPNKPTMIVHPGGPGVVLGWSNSGYDSLKPAFNIVAYHSRGSGCSAYPMTLAADKSLSLDTEVKDIEAIRNDLKIESWDVFFGISAGTSVARLYAARYPAHVKALILKAVAGPASESGSKLNELHKQAAQDIWSQFVQRQRRNVLSVLTSSQIDDLESQFIDLMSNVDAPYWALLKANYLKHLDPASALVKASPTLTEIPIVLTYDASDVASVDAILTEFVRAYQHLGSDLEGTTPQADNIFSAYMNALFPTKFAKENLDPTGFITSFRVLWSPDISVRSSCTNVPLLMIQGKSDLATPSTTAEQIFKDSSCYAGPTSLIEVTDGDHFNTVSDDCRAAAISAFLKDPGGFALPATCSSPSLTLYHR